MLKQAQTPLTWFLVFKNNITGLSWLNLKQVETSLNQVCEIAHNK